MVELMFGPSAFPREVLFYTLFGIMVAAGFVEEFLCQTRKAELIFKAIFIVSALGMCFSLIGPERITEAWKESPWSFLMVLVGVPLLILDKLVRMKQIIFRGRLACLGNTTARELYSAWGYAFCLLGGCALMWILMPHAGRL